jgi:hypothetical protein
MIVLATRSAALVQRLRARVMRLAATRTAARRRTGRAPTDWHSPTALWPDFTGVRRDGK